MKILHTVQLYHPCVGGSEEVVKQLSERLVKRGHDVTVATAYNQSRDQKIINGVKIAEFKLAGNIVNGIKGDEKEILRYQDFVLNNNFDVIMNYAAQIWSTDLVFPLLDKIKAKKFLVPCGYSALSKPEYEQYFKNMILYLKKYDKSIYLSDNYQDKKLAIKNNIKNIITIPNAASEDEFLANPSFDFKKYYNIKNDFLLTVANHYKDKGHDFVIKAYDFCQTNSLDLVIIGEKVSMGCVLNCKIKTKLINLKKDKKIHLLSSVPRNAVVSAFKQAKLFLFGSKIECSPLVLFESMAVKLPFISTDCGNSVELANWSGNKIALTPRQMAKQTDELLANQKEHEKISEQAFDLWKNNFTWGRIVDEYEKIYLT